MRDFDPTASEYISSGYLECSRPNGTVHYDPVSIFTAVAPTVIGGLFGGDSESPASAPQRGAEQQVQANTAAIDEARAARLQQRTDLAPWMTSGGAANNVLAARLGLAGGDNFGSLTKKFDAADLAKDVPYTNGLQFGIDTGVNQINDRAAAGGNYGSGAAVKAITRFGNDYATTKTAGAYDRNMGEKNQIFNFLSNQSAQGQSAAAGVGAAGIASAGAIGGYQTGIGNAQSAGTIGSANAVNQQIGGVTDAFRWNQLLSQRNNGQRNNGSNSYNNAPTVWGNGNAFSDTGDY